MSNIRFNYEKNMNDLLINQRLESLTTLYESLIKIGLNGTKSELFSETEKAIVSTLKLITK